MLCCPGWTATWVWFPEGLKQGVSGVRYVNATCQMIMAVHAAQDSHLHTSASLECNVKSDYTHP